MNELRDVVIEIEPSMIPQSAIAWLPYGGVPVFAWLVVVVDNTQVFAIASTVLLVCTLIGDRIGQIFSGVALRVSDDSVFVRANGLTRTYDLRCLEWSHICTNIPLPSAPRVLIAIRGRRDVIQRTIVLRGNSANIDQVLATLEDAKPPVERIDMPSSGTVKYSVRTASILIGIVLCFGAIAVGGIMGKEVCATIACLGMVVLLSVDTRSDETRMGSVFLRNLGLSGLVVAIALFPDDIGILHFGLPIVTAGCATAIERRELV